MYFKATLVASLAALTTVLAQGTYGGDQSSCSAAQSWVYKGCYPAQQNGNHAGFLWLLSSSTTNEKYYPGYTGSANLTVEQCQMACRGHNFQYAALWYGTECWCAPQFPTPQGSSNTSSGTGIILGTAPGTTGSGCTSTCRGNTTEFCGGGSASNIYQDPSYSVSAGSWQDYKYLGCFSNVNPGPTFVRVATTSSVSCASYCGALGYAYMTRSYYDSATGQTTCGCGSEIQAGLQIAESSCFYNCNGTNTGAYVTSRSC